MINGKELIRSHTVVDQVGAFLSELQEKYEHFMSEDVLSPILAEGRDKAYDISHKKLSAVFDKIGFLN
jgi:hypothetical protein